MLIIQIEINLYAVWHVLSGRYRFFDRLKPVLAADDFERVCGIILFRIFGDDVAKRPSLFGVFFHAPIRRVVHNDLPVSAVIQLIFWIKRHVGCAQGDDLATLDVTFAEDCPGTLVGKYVNLTLQGLELVEEFLVRLNL